MTIADRLAQLAAEPSPSRCPVCGFGTSLPLCVPCAERAALVESRREALRVWLDRRAGHSVDCAVRWPPFAGFSYECDCAAADEWRDFEGAEPDDEWERRKWGDGRG